MNREPSRERGWAAARPAAEGPENATATEALLRQVARGDTDAFAALYDRISGQVFGVIRRVLRDPWQSEEVTQEVLVEVWRTAARFDSDRGSANAWVLTMAHRRAIDRVRSAQSATNREQRLAAESYRGAYDVVAEEVETRLEHEQVRRCLRSLTDVQRESVTLAYYGGHTYREVAVLLDVPLGTVKTRMRDAMIRMRDCLGMSR